jgi:hypothetical protein
MIYKTIFLISLLFNISFASYEELRIGKIDDYYKDKISEQQLKTIIDEIEQTLETQLNMNIFDYSSNGKAIDILYVSDSKLEKDISKKIDKLNSKKEKLDFLNEFFLTQKVEIDKLEEFYTIQTNLLNKKVDILNNYIKEINKQKSLDKNEYNRVQAYVKNERNKINVDLKEQKKIQSNLTKTLNDYNQKVFVYNNITREINTLVSEIESMTRSVKRINGRTFGLEETTLKTIYKDGKMTQEKSVKTNMDKIEIYNFDSLSQLKVIIAHEIMHLLGIPHIEEYGALMNPLLQNNQLDKLTLTKEDIENFKNNF